MSLERIVSQRFAQWFVVPHALRTEARRHLKSRVAAGHEHADALKAAAVQGTNGDGPTSLRKNQPKDPGGVRRCAARFPRLPTGPVQSPDRHTNTGRPVSTRSREPVRITRDTTHVCGACARRQSLPANLIKREHSGCGLG
jgi:hypothetical protein